MKVGVRRRPELARVLRAQRGDLLGTARGVCIRRVCAAADEELDAPAIVLKQRRQHLEEEVDALLVRDAPEED